MILTHNSSTSFLTSDMYSELWTALHREIRISHVNAIKGLIIEDFWSRNAQQKLWRASALCRLLVGEAEPSQAGTRI